MSNPYLPHFRTEDENFIAQYTQETISLAQATKSPFVTREISLFTLMHMNPKIIEKLDKNGVKGKELYQRLCFRYQLYMDHNAPQERLPLLFEVAYESEAWKRDLKTPAPDLDMLEFLKRSLFSLSNVAPTIDTQGQLQDKLQEKRDEALFFSFVQGARYTRKYKEDPFEGLKTPKASLPNQNIRTDLIDGYLFKHGALVPELKPFLGKSEKTFPDFNIGAKLDRFLSLRNVMLLSIATMLGTCVCRSGHNGSSTNSAEQKPTIILLKENDLTGRQDTVNARIISDDRPHHTPHKSRKSHKPH